jgi:hypothetical protein
MDREVGDVEVFEKLGLSRKEDREFFRMVKLFDGEKKKPNMIILDNVSEELER